MCLTKLALLYRCFRICSDWTMFRLFQGGLCNESYPGKCVRHLHVRIGEYIGISPLIKKKFKPKAGAVSDHLLLCNHSPSFENFSLLTKENRKFVL